MCNVSIRDRAPATDLPVADALGARQQRGHGSDRGSGRALPHHEFGREDDGAVPRVRFIEFLGEELDCRPANGLDEDCLGQAARFLNTY